MCSRLHLSPLTRGPQLSQNHDHIADVNLLALFGPFGSQCLRRTLETVETVIKSSIMQLSLSLSFIWQVRHTRCEQPWNCINNRTEFILPINLLSLAGVYQKSVKIQIGQSSPLRQKNHRIIARQHCTRTHTPSIPSSIASKYERLSIRWHPIWDHWLSQNMQSQWSHFERLRGTQIWTFKVRPHLADLPPQDAPLKLPLAHRGRGKGEPNHCSLFVAEKSFVYQEKGGAECMR